MFKHFLVIVLSALAMPVLAQDPTFTSEDGEFSFTYNERDWDVEEQRSGTIEVWNEPILLAIYPPDLLKGMDIITSDVETIADVLDTLVESSGFSHDETQIIALDSGKIAVRAEIDVEEYEEISAAFMLVVEVGESYASVLAVGSDDVTGDDLEEAVYPIADTFEYEESGDDDSSDLPDDYGPWAGGDWEQVADALEEMELIPSGGDLIFEEPGLMLRTEDMIEVENEDVVMAALVSFRPADEEQYCGFIVRATKSLNSDDLKNFLFVGLRSNEELLVVETPISKDEEALIETFESPVDFYYPNHFLFVARGDTLNVFVNGEPVIEDMELNFDGDDELFATVDMGNSCVMTELWLYGLPARRSRR